MGKHDDDDDITINISRISKILAHDHSVDYWRTCSLEQRLSLAPSATSQKNAVGNTLLCLA